MLTINHIQSDKEKIIELLRIKNFDAEEYINEILKLDQKRKTTQKSLDDNKAEANAIAKEIGIHYNNKEIDKANKLKKRTSELKELSKSLANELQSIQSRIQELLIEIPNVPHPSVKPGKDETDNEIIRESTVIPKQNTSALPHWEILEKTNIIDFETGNKITGAGFPVYKGKGAKLQRALINFFLDSAVKQGFTEIEPPILVNESTAYGTGQLPDKEGQMYHIPSDNLYLIPTAEVPLTNIYSNSIINIEDLPIKFVSYTPCFRREAGSWGSHVRGLNRLHQFDKVEIVQLQHPDKSYDTLEEMAIYIESLVQALELPYRIVRLCGKDLSFTSALTYDYEVFSSGQKRWLEVSSLSNFESFQASRMKLRFRDKDKKNRLVHTLNGSALALPRIVAALLENNQTENYIRIPEILIPYTGFEKIEF